MRRQPLTHRALAAPHLAEERARRLFHPDHGWFRALERAASLWLARHVFPRLPGLPAVYSRQLARAVVLSHGDLPVPGLGAGLEGLRVLLLTDVHAGPFLRPATVAALVPRLRALAPDLVLHGGDLATSRLDEVDGVLDALAPLRGSLGTYAVLGNHDHYVEDPRALVRKIEARGIEVLVNRAVILRREGAALMLAGLDDLVQGRPDLPAALPARGERSVPAIVLSHNPDVFFAAAARGAEVVLSGHTHGGQIRVPGLPVLVRQSRFRLDEGRYSLPGSELVVSRGLETTGLPLRLFCPPEAVLLHLRAA